MELFWFTLTYLATTSFQTCATSLIVEEIDEFPKLQGVTLEEKETFLSIVEENLHQLKNRNMDELFDTFSTWLIHHDGNKPPIIHKPLIKPPNPSPPSPPSLPSPPSHHSPQPSCPKPPPSCTRLGMECTDDWRNSTRDANHSENPSNNLRNKKCCNEDICYNNRCCTITPATADHSICREDSHCCGSDRGIAACDTTVGLCKVPLGEMCQMSSDCLRGQCDGGICCYPSNGLPNARLITTSDHPCLSDAQCCGSGVCGMDGVCRIPVGGSCSCGVVCVSGFCSDGKCCLPPGVPCMASSNCCGEGYKCSDGKCVAHSLVCENFNMALMCPAGQTLKIVTANYGRTQPGSVVCPHPSILTTDCHAVTSLSVVQGMCQGQQSCTVAATNAVFGDPCVNTYKYLEVTYYCT